MDTIDVLAFAPHPDDAELYCSGLLLQMKQAGKTIGIIDLTKGELSTRGTLEIRARETQAATDVLSLDYRDNLEIPDGNIENSLQNRWKVIEVLRRCKPAMVLYPYFSDRHPDHGATGRLVHEAVFYSGLEKLQGNADMHLAPHRPSRIYHYMMTHDFEPDFYVDVSDVHDTKLEAIRAYRTQFFMDSTDSGPGTFVSDPKFLEAIIGRERRFGLLIGCEYAEGYKFAGPAALNPEALI